MDGHIESKNNGLSYDYVDLGLSVCWATCNLGATSPEQSGNFYSWGETSPKKSYKKSTYKFYVDENEGMNNAYGRECDAAFCTLGEGWRVPTKFEVEELFTKCDHQQTCINGINGILFTSKINQEKLFLPVCGSYYERGLSSVNYQGNYWTSSQCLDEDMYATAFCVTQKAINIWDASRVYGYAIRPVRSDEWDDVKMYQPKNKTYPESQYFWGYKKSGPFLTALFYLIIALTGTIWAIVCFIFNFISIGIFVLIVPPAFLGFVIHPSFFKKNDINNS